ncbi:MAG TPA: hypothetical protein VGB77_15735 [Abditibacteriaceae bacterium]|jgi:hypothetical protein
MKYQQTAATKQAAKSITRATRAAQTPQSLLYPRVGPMGSFQRPVHTNRPRTRTYNPRPIRRRVRVDYKTPEIVGGVTKSFTRNDKNIKHRPELDLVTGECRCSCEDFRFRRNPMAKKVGVTISIKTPLLHCKHLERFLDGCVQRGELTRDENKVLRLTHPQAAPVEKIVVPPHIDPDTGELKPGYLPNGEFDFNTYFD